MIVLGHLFGGFEAAFLGAAFGIQNCGCKIIFLSSFGKFVGVDLKNCRGLKGLFEKKVWVHVHPLQPR